MFLRGSQNSGIFNKLTDNQENVHTLKQEEVVQVISCDLCASSRVTWDLTDELGSHGHTPRKLDPA